MQNKLSFYLSLSLNYMKRGLRLLVPYILMNTLVIALFFIMYTTAHDEGLSKMSGGAQLQMLLNFGVWVIGIFSTVMILYTNSFLMKRRKKEIGLYNILGMGKRHIAILLLCETVIIGAFCLGAGLITGVLFSKLSLMLLLKMLQFPVTFTLSLSWGAVTSTCLLFILIFTAAFLWGMMQIHVVNPIELLKGSQTGEKEPKSRWLMTLVGLISLGAGYYLSLSVKAPIQALTQFFIAVLLVMVGTYLLFVTGSIVLLKRLRANKAFYYQPKNFPVISGMLYRMKQNAVGLANICLLSTMVIVTLTTTVSLYAGLEDSMSQQHPMDVLYLLESDGPATRTKAIAFERLHQAAADVGVGIQSLADYKAVNFYGSAESNGFKLMSKDYYNDKIVNLSLTDRRTFLENAPEVGKVAFLELQLKADEAFMVINGDVVPNVKDSYPVNNVVFKVHPKTLSATCMPALGKETLVPQILVVLPSEEAVASISKQVDPKSRYSETIGVDLSGNGDQEIAFSKKAFESIKGDLKVSLYTSKSDQTKNFLIVYGGFLFLGIFLGAIFLTAAVLILYYKQVTEGYEDQQRYEVMQKVGMTHAEIKHAIGTQTIFVFFLPLVMAVVHVAFAFNVINRLLALFGFTNTLLFIGCTVFMIIVFACFYYFVYKATVKTYFRIVQWQV